MTTRRKSLASLAALAAAPWLPRAAMAQDSDFPNRNLRMIVPFAPGGASDIIGRLILPTLQTVLGRGMIIDNRPGATGNIGMEAGARAAPDGYTMVLGNAGSTVINPSVFTGLSWAPLRDLGAVTLVAETPNIVVVNNTLPVNTIRELIDYTRARPGQLNYGSAGSASQNRLEMEIFARQNGMQVVNIPYRGGAGPAVTDLMAGHVSMMFVTLPSVLAQLRNNQIKALAVTTAERFPGLPAVPTLKEQGFPQNVSSSWQGMFVPMATPAPIVARLHAALTTTLTNEEVKRRLIEAGAVASPSPSPAAFSEFVTAEFHRWAAAIREIGVTPD
jgi:tripartite-type tricarboxylate transporter receptor subunit TctC